MHIGPPALPLTAAAFERALRSGHGRALQHVLAHGTDGHEDALITACLQCPIYNAQSEGSRAPWLAQMLGTGDLVRRAMLEVRTAVESGEAGTGHWDRVHRRELVKEFAHQGFPGARELLYAMLSRDPESADVLGARQIVELDGAEDLLYVAPRLGRWLMEDPDFWVDEELFDTLDEGLGPGTAESILEASAGSDPMIARYLSAVRSPPTEDVPHNGPRAPTDAAEERTRVFQALLDESDPERACRLLRVFARVSMPRYDDRLRPWLESDDPTLRWTAARACSRLSDPRVREAAQAGLARGRLDGLLLFVSNCQPGDYETIAGPSSAAGRRPPS